MRHKTELRPFIKKNMVMIENGLGDLCINCTKALLDFEAVVRVSSTTTHGPSRVAFARQSLS